MNQNYDNTMILVDLKDYVRINQLVQFMHTFREHCITINLTKYEMGAETYSYSYI
jgi:hypothetical protein